MNSRYLSLIATFIVSTLIYIPTAHAGFIDYFKDEEGETKWQYVANFTGSVLIVLLTITALALLVNSFKLRRSNRALREIRKNLQRMVDERTANLNESNRLLQKSMDDLEMSEAYLKSILDSMPLMLIGLDSELKITQWNASAEKISGVNSEKVLGQYLWDAYPTISIMPDQVKEAMEEKKPVNIRQGQRGMFYFDITLYALKTSRGKGMVILVDDVTQQTKTENLAIQRDKMSAIGELTSTMGYDLLPPLRAILSGLDLLQNQIGSEGEALSKGTIAPVLIDAVEHGKQASAIINNLLHFSRSLDDKKQKAALPELIDHSLDLAESLFSSSSGLRFKEIKIIKNYSPDLPQVPCFAVGLQQVFLSLFRHAFQTFDRGEKANIEPTITVDLSMFYDSLWIKVQHNGRGLSGEEQQVIFEPFFQSEQNPDENVENRLSFSYFIITEDHGGRMSVTSDLEIGTTFHIQLELR